ncbi:hypothetical protein AB840_06260 [Megasphaera cerevisiae DSM 20462]|uniref:Ribosomal processing cysteine protease Prp n=1 Tax=Megasphaera cerevisiae DSM 20462 TaxID=1122219 RepID=A0A0J6WW46_9FIRM|nr:ribosomal-processing cysteine protease Prp [Megasphaera cerevisiae]KMO86809.1 hypothetical protein AB840_06260 [Megasphaera cerevisiae DSM 20462]MCI1750723.1 ribosomal-processing cysteine protease Prp [Megasphaera cerevisiae]OKY53902.1 hypothetical protein BSR42_04880 [Megasphaera cerevisiae]SJZ35757.1 hypothetical protein SAMN05660900_00049 [Megasphaera cerevisiae DSM 20462]
MIIIMLQHDKHHILNGFEISGHSGYDEAGSDIVCAAVSALAQTALLGLMKYVPDAVKYDMQDGFLSVHVDPCSDASPQIILETMKLGLEQIARQYESYVVFDS